MNNKVSVKFSKKLNIKYKVFQEGEKFTFKLSKIIKYLNTLDSGVRFNPVKAIEIFCEVRVNVGEGQGWGIDENFR